MPLRFITLLPRVRHVPLRYMTLLSVLLCAVVAHSLCALNVSAFAARDLRTDSSLGLAPTAAFCA